MKRTYRRTCRLFLGLLACTVSMISNVHATVIFTHSRIIFPDTAKSVRVQLRNTGPHSALVQSWIAPGPSSWPSPAKLKIPFAVSPPVVNIGAHQRGTMQIFFAGDRNQLPQTRESLFWFTIENTPAVTQDSSPAPAGGQRGAQHRVYRIYRTRVKLFYRPSGLDGSQTDAIHKVRWTIAYDNKGYELHAVNDSPYYVSYRNLTVKTANRTYQANLNGTGLVPPQGHADFLITRSPPVVDATLQATAINDEGKSITLSQPLAAQ